MTRAIYWMRRDLRWEDNHALSEALRNHSEVYPVFIFDKNITSKLERGDRRLNFLLRKLEALSKMHHIHIFYGDPVKLIPKLVKDFDVASVYANEDYEKYAIDRDSAIGKEVNIQLYKDHIIFHGSEVQNKQGFPYKVFTPYKRAWIDKLNDDRSVIASFNMNLKNLAQNKTMTDDLSKVLEDFDYFEDDLYPVKFDLDTYKKEILTYSETRDFPSLNTTSKIGVHLRFGTLSIRSCVRHALDIADEANTWLSQLIWRDFFSSILVNFPYVETLEFQEKYQNMPWRDDSADFKRWCDGHTGFPIIDAGMRELKSTGNMHNRVRMIVASFLTKNLLIDWRKGEAHFAKYLMDFDLASNNGSWQWASSTGVDAQPYFRVFNPTAQSLKFDKKCDYILRWCPELRKVPAKYIHDPTKLTSMDALLYGIEIDKDYPSPMVDLKETRLRAIEHFKSL